MLEFGGQGPLASSPRVAVSPIPSIPCRLLPQHLRVVSFCGEKQPRRVIHPGASGVLIFHVSSLEELNLRPVSYTHLMLPTHYPA